ncbi:MAG: P-loop NTPase fold protein [Alphaproteobacteria bacterium]
MTERSKIKREVLFDEPSKDDLFHGKGHERIASALANAIEELDDEDRAIGLEGPWGSGKSSVVEMAQKELKERQTAKKCGEQRNSYHFFTYDIWKSQGVSFRRSFLEHIIHWCRLEKIGTKDQLDKLEKMARGKTREIDLTTRPELDIYGMLVLLLIPALPLYFWWVRNQVSPSEGDGDWTYPILTVVIFVLGTLGFACVRTVCESGEFTFAQFRQVLSKMLLVTNKRHEDQKYTEEIREIDPDDFEFHSIFREVLATAQNGNKRIVVILDNIDRLPSREITQYWATVRSVFTNDQPGQKSVGVRSITAIIPYDRQLVKTQIQSDSLQESGKKSAKITLMGERELFSKTFDEIFIVSPPVMSNVREFFNQKLSRALKHTVENEEQDLVYMIYTELLKEEKSNPTPRQIISFINDLTALYVLHDGKFALSTVAAFIAHRDQLESLPEKLANEGFLEDKICRYAPDKNLKRSLAAIAFNVDEELAFEVLLDKPINDAATSNNAHELLQLSESAGFDERVEAVVRQNCNDWMKGGNLAIAIENFADLANSKPTTSTQRYSAALVEGFFNETKFDPNTTYANSYLRVLELTTADNLEDVVRHYLQHVWLFLTNEDEIVLDGSKVGEVLRNIESRLNELGQAQLVSQILQEIKFPKDMDFLRDAAASLTGTNFTLNQFDLTNIKITNESIEHFSNLAVREPEITQTAFQQFRASRFLSHKSWAEIANHIIVALTTEAETEEGNTEFDDTFDLLTEIWSHEENETRNDIDLTALFSSSRFYILLKQACDEGETTHPLLNALQMAGPRFNEDGLPDTDNSDEANWFYSYFSGATPLNESDIEQLCGKIFNSNDVGRWLLWSARSTDNKLAWSVTKQSFNTENLFKFVSLVFFLDHTAHLKDVLDENYNSMLARYSALATEERVAKVGLPDCRANLIKELVLSNIEGWEPLLKHIEKLLNEIPATDWRQHILEESHEYHILVEFIEIYDFQHSDPKFRQILEDFILDMLSEKLEFTGSSPTLDSLIKTLNPDEHKVLYRNIRERMDHVTQDGLAHTATIFPMVIRNLLDVDRRISPLVKERIVRHLLAPALEGRIKYVLDLFEGFGHAKVGNFIENSVNITQQHAQAALRKFKNENSDKDWVERIETLINGKKSRLEKWLTPTKPKSAPLPEQEDEDESEDDTDEEEEQPQQ